MQPQYITLGKDAVDITNQRFGRLVALGPVGRSRDRKMMWLCQCDCGKTAVVAGRQMRRGTTRSCGCLHDESFKERVTKHGHARHPVYHTWLDMISRCHVSSSRNFQHYGARGIAVCEEWQTSFVAFAEHVSSLEHYLEKGYSLDRIDNDGNYRPGNVRWATRAAQARNTTKNRLLTFQGKSQCLTDWADEYGLRSQCLATRLTRGWTLERALTTPPLK